MIRNAARAALLLAALTITSLIATPASAQPVKPRWGEGIASMVTRTCQPGTDWRDEAARLGVTKASDYLIRYDRTYDLCRTGDEPQFQPTRPAQQQASRDATRSATKVDQVLGYARAQLGKPYVWAQDGPRSFDCSGLVLAAYRQVDIHLPHQSRSMLAHGREVSKANLAAGDVVWLQPQRGTKGHVGLYLGDGQVIEASSSRGRVVIRALGNRYWTARRLL